MKILGWVLYVVSFALPAAQWRQGSGELLGGPMKGWNCALATLLMPWASFKDNPLYAFCMLIAGLTNLFVIAYAIRLWRKPQSIRPTRTAAIFFTGFLFSWITMAQQGLIPRIGHYVWILGIVLIVGANWIVRRSQEVSHA